MESFCLKIEHIYAVHQQQFRGETTSVLIDEICLNLRICMKDSCTYIYVFIDMYALIMQTAVKLILAVP